MSERHHALTRVPLQRKTREPRGCAIQLVSSRILPIAFYSWCALARAINSADRSINHRGTGVARSLPSPQVLNDIMRL